MELEVEASKPPRKGTIRQRIHKLRRGITVEPFLICFCLPYSMSALTIQNLSLEKACRVNLNLNTSVCDAIHQHIDDAYDKVDEIAVQKVVASAYVWKNVIFSVFPAILLPLLGSWSDRHNTRKVLMLLPMAGEVITNVGFILCTFFFYELPMEVNTVVEVLPTAITGGINMLLLGVFTYVASISSIEDRTFRLGVIHILYGISTTVGYACSGIVYTLIGFYGVFVSSLIMYALGGLYAYYGINEAPCNRPGPLSKCARVKDMVNVKQTLTTFNFLWNRRRAAQSKQIYLILILAILVLGPGQGNSFAILIFSKWLKFDDAILGIISSVSKIGGGIVYIFAQTTLVFYLGTLAEVFNGTAFAASRSIITKLVLEQDLGKVNSLFGMAEAITTLIYGPAFSALYKSTIQIFPGTFFVVGSCLTIPPIIMYIWLYSKRNERFVSEVHSGGIEHYALDETPKVYQSPQSLPQMVAGT
ncbi:proton-coupled folate transporter-like isoform X2 [Photinus pyralis]|uniref:proton-coupled folate transporter-like isoform X2 n=1 Tax=Photinus pyralis TaxID=7054 RepID=UPI0012671550|nr:proton-coupled folate transporter-like isoform X2 [Photinus pyralis]